MLDVELLPAQSEYMFLNHEYSRDVAIYQGGFGSGKTFCGALLGIMLCLTYTGIKGLVGALTLPLIIDTTLEKYFEHLDNLGYKKGVDYCYNKSAKRLLFRNPKQPKRDRWIGGSEIYFRHFADPERLKSLEVGFIEIEEMSLTPESTFKQLLGRLRQTKLFGGEELRTRRLFGHTNPEPTKGYIYRRFAVKSKDTVEFEDTEKEYSQFINGEDIHGKYRTITKVVRTEVEKPSGGTEEVSIPYRMVIAPTTQNVFLPADYIGDLQSSYDYDYFLINVLGQFGDYSKGLITKRFNKERQLLSTIAIDNSKPIHLTCDFNVNPMCWYIAQHDGLSVKVIDEIIQEEVTTEMAMREFVRRYPVGSYPRIILNGDASGNWKNTQAVDTDNTDFVIMENSLRRLGYEVKNETLVRNTHISFRIKCWNGMIMNSYGQHRIFISEKCVRLLEAIDNLKYNLDGVMHKYSLAELEQNPSFKYYEHCFDAITYLVCYYYPIEKEVSKTYYKKRQQKDPRFSITELQFGR